MLHIEPINALSDNYIWAIIHPKKKTCAIVDPGAASPVLNYLKEHALTLVGILITHHHWDHTGGINDILQHHTAPIFGPSKDNISILDHFLDEGKTAHLPELEASFQVLDIPSHTLGHIAYYGHGVLFSGDTLFTAGCGRIFEGNAQQMKDALDKLTALPDDTLVYCGHEYTENNLRFAITVEPDNSDIQARLEDVKGLRAQNKPTVPATLALEKKTNPFLRCHLPSVKAAAENYAAHPLNTPTDVLRAIRTWKDHF